MSHPYETANRLGSREQQDELRDILGLKEETLTNVDPIPRPLGGGAGRVKKFRTPSTPVTGASPAPAPAPVVQQQTLPATPRGYPTLARFYASDKSFFLLRRFDELAARNLLFIQDELCQLERDLQAADQDDTRAGPQGLQNLHSRRGDRNQSRAEIMQKIREKLTIYQKSVLRQSQMMQLEKATPDAADSLINWLDGIKPTTEVESHFADDPEDLISLGGIEEGKEYLERFIEKHFSHWFTIPTGTSSRHMVDPNLQYYSSESIKTLARVVISVAAVLFLAAPTATLYFVQSANLKFLFIIIYSAGFAFILSVWTKSRSYEIFAAMAAYAAFLVFFLGTIPESSS
ncbi:uncharacterized protein BKA55DRAFT_546992 [Fusarium redolens]|uniref:DUF6594 domain-containing protein n=1 Tax=Fusarium redolens TaxID=48865 RepID=A0A9P9JPC7_FUSRE|nr:uncharacterized protein BKA55DRAFT_546992 [Fusarium redolens]KAH7207915.1 hypothetical protein BKA55DRAFT_546992 [Fusarium redolens]